MSPVMVPYYLSRPLPPTRVPIVPIVPAIPSIFAVVAKAIPELPLRLIDCDRGDGGRIGGKDVKTMVVSVSSRRQSRRVSSKYPEPHVPVSLSIRPIPAS